MPAKKTNNQPADNIFAPVEPTPAAADQSPIADKLAAFDAATGNDPAHAANQPDQIFAANTPGAPGTIDFAKLAADAKAHASQHSGMDHGATGDNTPIDITTGNAVTGGFFMDLTKEDDLALIDVGTRLVVSCTAAEAVISSGGNPMINLRVKAERVVSAPDMDRAVFYPNRSIRDRLMFIPANPTTGKRGTIWRAKQAIEAFGVAFDAQAFRSQADFMAWLRAKCEALIGSVCEITVGVDDGTNGGTKEPEKDPATGDPYPPKNTIARFYPYKPAAATSTEDLPF